MRKKKNELDMSEIMSFDQKGTLKQDRFLVAENFMKKIRNIMEGGTLENKHLRMPLNKDKYHIMTEESSESN